MLKAFEKIKKCVIMALSKKQKNEVLNLPIFVKNDNEELEYSSKNEKIVLKTLEDFEDNEVVVTSRLVKNEKKLSRLQILTQNDKKIAKKLEVRLAKLEDKINSDKSLIRNWINPTLEELNERYLDFIEAKYEEDIDKYLKEVEEEE